MTDMTDMKPELHERKWEIDSHCYVIRLAHEYWKETGDASVFGDLWLNSIKLTLQTFKEQQKKDGHGPYVFQRKTERQLDTMSNGGKGHPVNPVGLIASAFRPSDDATTFQFLIPSNFFAVTSLRRNMLHSTTRNTEQFTLTRLMVLEISFLWTMPMCQVY
jgi:meiotically up-regulated gene 157 (Mug157) protein